MDVTLGIFAPESELSLGNADAFDDVITDAHPDQIIDAGQGLSLNFEPMDMCSGDDQNDDFFLSCIDNIAVSLEDEISNDLQLDQSNSSGSACSECAGDTKLQSECKNCSLLRSAQYDSGVGSGDDVTDSSSDHGSSDASKNCNPGGASLRRSTRRKTSVQNEYNLRTSSLINRVEVERRKATPKEPKPKSRPPPLSKYRRKTANARERTRMSEINEGFEELKKAIPELPKGKLTKITTLRLALNYIAALREMLGYKDNYDYSPSGSSYAGSPSSSEAGSVGSSDCNKPNMCAESDA